MLSARATVARLAARGPVRGLATGLVAGVLVALSVPPFGWWPLGWVGLAVLAGALPGRSWRYRLALGAGFGLGDYVIGLLWVQEFSVPGYIGVVVISAAYATAALLLVPTGRRRYVAVALPAVLVLADWARDRFPLGGLPLAGLSLGQAAGPLAPVLRVGGGLALTAETALVGVALAELYRMVRPAVGARSRRRLGRPWRLNRSWLALLPLLVAMAGPLLGLIAPSGAGGHWAPLRVGLVQGGGPRGTRAINTDPQVVFLRHLAASGQLHGPFDLIVWPEGVLQSHSSFEATVDAASLATLARDHRATLVSGVEQDVGPDHYLNEVVAWGPDGRVTGSYVKNHLVPFGEYVPYRSFIRRYFNIADVPYDAIPGHGPGILRTPAGPLATMISYEVFFDERARSGVTAGGRLLVVPTNTASYRSTQVPTQEVAADRMRAWETGRWLVQVTPTGYSTVVSPTGAVIRRTPLDARRVVEATVPQRSGMTIYDRLGDGPVALASLLVLAAAVTLDRRRLGRRSRQDEAVAGTEPVAVPSA